MSEDHRPNRNASPRMRLLHITDLHYAKNSPFQVNLIKALLSDLRVQAAAEPLDLVVFSGDLVNNPDEPNIYEELEKNFLGPVLATIALKPSDVIFAPVTTT